MRNPPISLDVSLAWHTLETWRCSRNHLQHRLVITRKGTLRVEVLGLERGREAWLPCKSPNAHYHAFGDKVYRAA